MTDRGGTGFVANTVANLSIGVAALGYAVIVPAVVVRRFGAGPYGSWYLAFQVAAYVVLLDLGSQLVVTNEAAAPSRGAASARLATAAMVGQSVLAVGVLAVAAGWAALTGQSTLAQLILILGVAATASLLASTVRAWFGGLRRAHVPAIWLVAARVGALAGLALAVATGAGLVTLTLAVAVPPLIVHACLLVWANRPPSPWARPDGDACRRLVRATVPLALWAVCGILIGGVDIFIVRAVDPSEVGRYAVALPLLAVPTGAVTAAITAWMPRVAHVQAASPQRGRDAALPATTVMTALLAMGALAFVVYAGALVRLLAGAGSWGSASTYLQVLYVATALRFVLLPYVVLVVVRGEQGMILLSPVAEAATNVAGSVLLGLWLGAVGVALGTLAGAVVALAIHLRRSVRRTPGTGISAPDLVVSMAGAWPPLAASIAAGAVTAEHAPPLVRGVALAGALAADCWWLLGRRQTIRAAITPMEAQVGGLPGRL